MKPYWRGMGLTEEGAARADRAIPLLVEAVAILGDRDLARLVLREAVFRVFDLPSLTHAYQRQYRTRNGLSSES